MESISYLHISIVLLLSVCLVVPAYPTIVNTYSNVYDLRIPADAEETKGWMTDAILEIPDHQIIDDLDLNLSIVHTQAFDLQIFLKSPAGTRMLINMYDPLTEFFEGEDYTNTVFDDEAAVRIEDAQAPFTGSFRPKEPGMLSIFDGEDAFGQWSLQVYDGYFADSGKLTNFGLSITYIPEPATLVILTAGSALALTRKQQPAK